MKPNSCKAKGRKFQGEVVAIIRAFFPELSADDVRGAIMGETGEDIKLSALGKRRFPFSIECKKRESLNVWEAVEQAESNARKSGLNPVLVFSRNRSPAYAVVPLSLFMEMARSFNLEEVPSST